MKINIKNKTRQNKTRQNKTRSYKTIIVKQKGSSLSSPKKSPNSKSIFEKTIYNSPPKITYNIKTLKTPLPLPLTNYNTTQSFNELLSYLLQDTTNSVNAIKSFEFYIKNHYSKGLSRSERYDITILCALMNIMFDYKKPVMYYVKESETKKLINANNINIKYCDKTKLKNKKNNENKNSFTFFNEDIYCEDLNLFISEYDKFINHSDNKSEFFFKSNIANIALLFKCYYNQCFDDYLSLNENNLTSNKDKLLHFNDLKTVFLNDKKKLLNFLIKAYISCFYHDVCNLYINYLNFYKLSIGSFLKSKSIDIYNSEYDDMYEDIIKNINNSYTNPKKFLIYLSCIHTSEYKQARFYMTRFIDSYIGQGNQVHDGLYFNTLDVIAHDFYTHNNISRILKDTQYDVPNRDFILSLFNDDKDKDKLMYKIGMSELHYIQNEINSFNTMPQLFDKTNFYKYYLHSINENIKISFLKIDDNVKNFVKWFMPSTIKYTFDDKKRIKQINNN
jgi:hypothetical protein